MRVISGIAKGTKLLSPEGIETRPTSDMTKESIFNIIRFNIEGRDVLDLFAGTGQMGIEALSNGAKSAVFVEKRAECLDIIRKNLAKTKFEELGRVERTDCFSYLSGGKKHGFGLIFMDPPYGEGILQKSLEKVFEKDMLKPGGLIVCEGLKTDVMPECPAPYEKGREYIYGKSKITLYTRGTL